MRYLKIWFSLAVQSLRRSLEYRLDFAGKATIEVVWCFTQILFFHAVLSHTPSIASWSSHEIYFFVGCLMMIDSSITGLLYENHQRFGELIRKGTFDFYLLYPFRSWFVANFRVVNPVSLVTFAIGLGLCIHVSKNMVFSLSWMTIPVLAVYGILGGLSVALLGIAVMSVSFWGTQSSSLMWLFFELYKLGWRPESFYAGWLQRLLIVVFPAAFFVSIPVQLALGKLSGWWFVAPWIWVAVLLAIAGAVWTRGIRRYESAMS